MTETRLRTWSHSAAYSLTAIVLSVLALQNLRYGFYQLFYLALAMTALLLAGLIYTLIRPRASPPTPRPPVLPAGPDHGPVAAVPAMPAPGIRQLAQPLAGPEPVNLPLRQGLALSALLLVPVIAR